MASQMIVQSNEADSQQHVSKVTASASAITLPVGSGQSSTVQRIVKTSSGTQIYLSGLPNNARAVGLNIGSKRPHTPDNVSQPPTKIKLTHSDSNVNVPIVSSVSSYKTVSDDRNVLSFRGEGVKTPTKIMHVTGNTVIPANARRLVLSPVKSVGGKVTMVPMNTANQRKTLSNAAKLVNVGRSLSFSTNSTGDSNTVTLSPQKIIIKGQDNSSHNVIIQQKNVSNPQIVNSSANVQPIPVSGSKFQYVRLVSSNANNIMPVVSKTTSSVQLASAQHRTLAPHTIAPTTVIAPKLEPTFSAHKPQQAQLRTTKSSHQPSQQRLILPASTPVSIRPAGSGHYNHLAPNVGGNTQTLSGLPPGTAIISGQNMQGMQGVQGFALVPAQYVSQLQQQYTPAPAPIQPSPQTHLSQHNSSSSSRHDGSFMQVQQSTKPVHKVQSSTSNPVLEGHNRPRKPCNCTKSQCLKLYCECFANGEFCFNCNCNNCYNNLEHEDERSRAIKQCLDRNPNAFRPKIGKDKNVKGERRHNKGCNCKRSGCLKNYCECYEAKIMCTHLCKCVGCKNFEESPEKKTLMHLADAAEVRKQQQVSAKHKLSTTMQDLPSRPATASTGRRLPYSFVTSDVCEATCSCLVAAAEETERTRQIDTIQEKLILEEFGRCLMQVIESANRTEPGTAV